jgi:hypothetical protein
MSKKFLIKNLLPEIHAKLQAERFTEWKDRSLEKIAEKNRNRSLPAEEFNGRHWRCLSAGEAGSAQFTGWFTFKSRTN